jgi:hypothetical protein
VVVEKLYNKFSKKIKWILTICRRAIKDSPAESNCRSGALDKSI